MKLVPASTEHMLLVQSWFNSHEEIYAWGGPKMAYPMSQSDFLALTKAPHLSSYSLVDKQEQVVAFGQHYIRLEHHHLGRLAVNPENRGQGLAKILVSGLLKRAYAKEPANGASLFVFTDNQVAYNCYQSLGFVETKYPTAIPGNMQHCVYMVLPNPILA